MKKLVMVKGLQGSGKSTWTREQQSIDHTIVRVNKDDLRALLHNGVHSKGHEKFVLKVRDAIIKQALAEGHHVIVDDTNFNPAHEATLRAIAEEYEAEFSIKDMREKYTSDEEYLESSISNDLKRFRSVGERVIRHTYNQYLRPSQGRTQLNPKTFSEELPYCVIFDLDGTLACIGDRSPYDGRSCAKDLPNISIITLNSMVEYYKRVVPDLKVIIFSGRNEDSEMETTRWLKENVVNYDEIHMRKIGDIRNDSIVKREMFDQFIVDKYNVGFVVDDRDRVVEMWRELGLTCLQVAPGDF